MRGWDYIKDQKLIILLYSFITGMMYLTLNAFHIQQEVKFVYLFLQIVLGILLIGIRYFRMRAFYNDLIHQVNQLEEAYYVIEMMKKPRFYEGKIVYDVLYQINKSMIERLNQYYSHINDFKDYVEMWIHEVKIPIASLVLMTHNRNLDHHYIQQIQRLENYVEQILYYVRSENTEKDFMIKEIRLDKLIGEVALKYKNDLLDNQMEFHVEVHDYKVMSDAKWLVFMIGQIINNAIKYKKENGYLSIKAEEKNKQIHLIIEDHGIGISPKDLSRVFDKSFTGENGHTHSTSTGMGLYIVKKLCDKLGHSIKIESEVNQYTRVIMIFNEFDYYLTGD